MNLTTTLLWHRLYLCDDDDDVYGDMQLFLYKYLKYVYVSVMIFHEKNICTVLYIKTAMAATLVWQPVFFYEQYFMMKLKWIEQLDLLLYFHLYKRWCWEPLVTLYYVSYNVIETYGFITSVQLLLNVINRNTTIPFFSELRIVQIRVLLLVCFIFL